MNNFVCVYKSGGVFTFNDYVLPLYRALQKHHKGSRVICLTDITPSPVNMWGVEVWPFREQWHVQNARCSKMELLRHDLPLPFVYLDLDTAVLGPIPPLPEDDGSGRVWMLRDLWAGSRGASGVMVFPPSGAESRTVLLTEYLSDQQAMWNRYGSDDGLFFWERLAPTPGLLQDIPVWRDAVCGFKPVCRNHNVWLQDPGAHSIVCFHGTPRPHEAASVVSWVRMYWRSNDQSAHTNP